MSDAQHSHIDDARTLARICGYSPEHALAELTAFSHREKAGLISASRALELLVRTASTDAPSATNQRLWLEILRGTDDQGYLLAA